MRPRLFLFPFDDWNAALVALPATDDALVGESGGPVESIRARGFPSVKEIRFV